MKDEGVLERIALALERIALYLEQKYANSLCESDSYVVEGGSNPEDGDNVIEDDQSIVQQKLCL